MLDDVGEHRFVLVFDKDDDVAAGSGRPPRQVGIRPEEVSTMPTGDSVQASGLPLAFRVAKGDRRAAVLGTAGGRDVFTVEARMLAGRQKEAVVGAG
jgi:hypothetical protein